MKRLVTAILIIMLTLFFSVSGEHNTADTAEKLCRGAEQLRNLCEQYDRSADQIREKIGTLRSEWDKDAKRLTLYMNERNMRPVTEALRDMKDAASDGDVQRVREALRQLGYAVDDLRNSEKLSFDNVF